MTFEDYIEVRRKNQKINSKDDLQWLQSVGKDMKEFWDNSKSQMNLLWALRGLGRDHDADKLWDWNSNYQDAHKCELTPEDRSRMADAIRHQYNNPFNVLRDVMGTIVEEGTHVIFLPTSLTEPLVSIIIGTVQGETVSATWQGDGKPYGTVPILLGNKLPVIRADNAEWKTRGNVLAVYIIMSCVAQGKIAEAKEVMQQLKERRLHGTVHHRSNKMVWTCDGSDPTTLVPW